MAVHGDDFIDAFSEALRRAYIKHKPEKGDSWLEMDMSSLYMKLDEEIEEYNSLMVGDNPAPEMVDIGLMSAMLWWRENGHTTPHVQPPR